MSEPKSGLKRRLEEIYEQTVPNQEIIEQPNQPQTKKRISAKDKLEHYKQGATTVSAHEIAKAGSVDVALDAKNNRSDNDKKETSMDEDPAPSQRAPTRDEIHGRQSDTDKLLMEMNDWFKENPDVSKFVPRWDRIADEKYEIFFMYNKLANVKVNLKSPNRFPQLSLDTDLDTLNAWKAIQTIGDSLPYPCVSFFVSEADMQMFETRLNGKGKLETEWQLQLYNVDPRMAAEAMRSDESNFKVACNPHLMLIDKYSWFLLKTFDFKVLFPPSNSKQQAAGDDEPPSLSGFEQKYVYRFLLGEPFPKDDSLPADSPQNKDHFQALENRNQLLYKTIEMLLSRREEEIAPHAKALKDFGDMDLNDKEKK